MVFQSYALFPHLSVRREHPVRRQGAQASRRPSTRARLARVADLLGLTQLLERKPSQLSGGQQQRVALGRAIIAETPVCLMDEPLSNLDAQLRQEMRREIRALQQQLGITMVYVTHDQTEAMSMADQVVLLNAGRIEQDAPPAELYARPAIAVRGALHRHAADERRSPRPADADLRARRPARARAPRRAAAGVARASCRAPSTSAPTPSSPARLGRRHARDTIAARLPGRRELAAGTRGRASAGRADDSHYFDAATGRAPRRRRIPFPI